MFEKLECSSGLLIQLYNLLTFKCRRGTDCLFEKFYNNTTTPMDLNSVKYKSEGNPNKYIFLVSGKRFVKIFGENSRNTFIIYILANEK